MKNTNPFVKKHQQSSQMQSPNLNSFHQGNATSNSEAETINNPRGGSVNSYKTLDPVGSPSIPQQSATPAPPSSIIESIVHTEADSKNAANMNGENGELAASFKTFGISLSQLILLEQDSLLPKFVKQCIHVIDKYGLDIEGIYRKSSNVLELQKYIKLINQDPSNYALLLPPRSSENGHGVEEHVILVSNLLKHFFKNLPVKFISSSFLSEFQTYIAIPSNSESNIVMKRNYMHGIVYKLKDEQYWVLRALLFHFKRILDNSNVNRMSLKAMCIIWGPILISSPSGDDLNSNQNEFGDSNLSLDNSNEYMKDVQFQIKVMEGLFDVAEQAFEPE